MKIAFLDTISGISGDMLLGAFLSAGVPVNILRDELQKLHLDGFELKAENVSRNGIAAIKATVLITNQPKYHRNLNDITAIIDKSDLNNIVKENSKKIFYELARAEAKVHNSTIDKIHFHEVGALDAIIDIVGTSICLDFLHIEKVFTTPVKLGCGGFVETMHGKMPIPAPATVELLKDYNTVLTDLPFELTTPTGAAIIKSLSNGILQYEKIEIQTIGYGAGSLDLIKIPNLLRLFIADLHVDDTDESAVTIETNIDDMNPEIYPYIIEKLLAVGAYDAYLIPVIMKKGRPGILLSVLADKCVLNEVMNIIFKQTTTLGLRIQEVRRKKLVRSSKIINTSFGDVHVKIISNDGVERYSPEFEECKRIANDRGISILEVYSTLENELLYHK
jgi:pyridinium-3,5-bisthiocarboxylic acid mononucleotide nickel chelatase